MGGNEAIAQTTPPADCPTINFPNPVCVGDNCGAGTPFTVGGNTTGITSYRWDFGDTSSQADTSSLQFPSYRYNQPGTFNGTLTIIRNNGVTQTCRFTVNVQRGVPEFDITPDDNLGPQDEEICKGSSATLTPSFRSGSAPAGATYLWSTGATTRSITVPDTVGCYSLTITDPVTRCSRSQKINITVYKPDPNNPPPPKEESRWYFGNGAGIRFVGGQPEAITGTITAPEGVSAVSGSTGKLLFYTDGRNVYDRAGTPMKDLQNQDVTVANNNALNGGANATQGVLIIAQPGCNDCDPVYYIFTTSDIGTNGSQLSYSVVDMRRNGGTGLVTVKNVPLWSTSTERVVGVRGQADPNAQNAQETTYIITHDFRTNTFRVYPLTTQGIGQPKTYDVGVVHATPAAGEGSMKVYDDKLVVTIPGGGGTANIVQIFAFDNTTGEVKPNPLTITMGLVPPAAPLYGVELFGDSLLYVSTKGGAGTPSQLIQFNLAYQVSDSIIKYQKILATSATEVFGALQSDPNGQRIYLAKGNSSSLGVITSPGGIGAAAGFQPSGFALSGGQSQLGLPNTSPPDNQGYGQGVSFDPPPCTPPDTPVQLTFRAQPDRAGGDPTKSSYAWRFTRQDGTVLASFPDAGLGVNDSLQVTFPGPGNYSVTLAIDNDCLTVPESFTEAFTIPVAPPPFTLRDTSVCAGATVRLEAYAGSAGPQGVTYAWLLPNGQTRPGKAIDVTVADVTANSSLFRVLVANGSCSQQASVRVNFVRIPVNLGNDTTLCAATTLLLNAGNPGMQYQWRENGQARPETTQTISVRPGPGSTTTFEVTVTDPRTNCSGTDQIVIRRGAAPQVTVTPTPVTGCELVDGRLAVNFNSPGPNIFSVVRQSDGAPLISNEQTSDPLRDFPDLAAGGYRVTVRNTTSGCDTTIIATIGTNDPNAPQVTVAPVTVLCNNQQGTRTITAALTNPVAGGTYAYEWRDTANAVVGTTANLTARPGVYSVRVTYLNCVSAKTGQIMANSDNPRVTVTQIPNGCGQFLLRAALSGPDSNPARFSFTWNGPGININAERGRDTLTVSGAAGQTVNYTVRVANVPADPNTDPVCQGTPVNIPVVYPAIPEFDYPGNAGPACEGESVLLNAPADSYWDTYIWTLPGGARFSGRQYSATVGGRYRITVRNSRTGCERSDDVEVTINPRPAAPQVQNPAPVCAGGSIPQLSATGQNLRWYADPSLTRQLSQGPGTPAFLPPVNNTIPGSYTYYVTQTVNGCESLPAAATLVVAPGPQVNLGPDRTVCQGETVVLNATSQIQNATYRWTNGQTGPVLNATRSGTYGVTVTVGTCSVTDEVTLTFVAGPQPNIPRKEVPLCFADGQRDVVLDAGPGANFTYEWRALGSTAILGTNRTLTVVNLGRYTITISNGSSCIVNDTITVADKCEPRVFVPDAFTPNSDRDAVNSTLEVRGNHVGRIEMMVYNRWGELIYENRASDLEDLNRRAWDGNFLGRPAPTGTYVWKITYRSQFYPERDPVSIRGGILLLR